MMHRVFSGSLPPMLRRLLHVYWRFSRGVTFGVRGVVIDAKRRVLLVEHSYVAGWHLPGGGVEVGETAEDALRRELAEEGGVIIRGRPRLHGVFFNRRVSRRDHVAVYVVTDFDRPSVPPANREIVASGFFALDALPAGTTQGTRARLAEIFHNQPLSADWS